MSRKQEEGMKLSKCVFLDVTFHLSSPLMIMILTTMIMRTDDHYEIMIIVIMTLMIKMIVQSMFKKIAPT